MWVFKSESRFWVNVCEGEDKSNFFGLIVFFFLIVIFADLS